MVSTLVPREVCCDTYILHGVPFHEILQFAYRERIGSDRHGARGRTGIKNVLFGHTAEGGKKSPCPVLSVRHPSTVLPCRKAPPPVSAEDRKQEGLFL